MATVVVLNGTSSSGKTTLAREFQELAPSRFLNFSIDSILQALPPSTTRSIAEGESIADLRLADLHAAYFACVRQLATLGHDLVIDNAITSRFQAERLVEAVDGHRVLMVLVACSEDVLRKREHARGDRRMGMAVAQLPSIARWLQYDLQIDTSVIPATDGARAIVEALAQQTGGAFERTCAALGTA